MFNKEFHFSFTLADIGKVLCFSPVVVVLIYLVICLPWESASAPSWVQAVGSVLALIGAAILPIYHSRQVEIRRERMTLGQLRLLSEECYEKMWMLSNCFLNPQRQSHAIELFLSGGRNEEWQALERAVTQYPLELVPAEHLSALNSLRNSVSHALLICRRLSDWKDGNSNPELVGLLRARRDLLALTKATLPWPEGDKVLLDKFHQERGIQAELANPPAGPVLRSGAKVYVTWFGPKECPDSAMVQILMPYGEPEVINLGYEVEEGMQDEDRGAIEKRLWARVDMVISEEYLERSF